MIVRLEEELLERTIMSRGNLSPGLDDPNKPPSVSVPGITGATVAAPVLVTAFATDDGLPKPRIPKIRPEVEPGKAQTNSAGAGRRYGLNVTWMQYRGPAKVTFDHTDVIPVIDGKAVTTAHFP